MNHADILEKAWTLLERGVKDRNDDFHTPVLTTIGKKNFPEARTVILRRVMRDSRNLLCHADVRTPKVAEVRANPNVSWLFYHKAQKLQLRARGTTTVHTTDELADAQWQSSQLFSRRCYCGLPPGTLADAPTSGLPADLIDRAPTESESEQLGRPHFAVINTTVHELDVYELNVRGHRRSLFIFNENGEAESRWLTP